VSGKRSRISRYSSGRSSMSGSVPETEDLYCDDELHPSLENDPNMQLQLFSAPLINELEDQLHHFTHQQSLFSSLDGESVLSMEVASTGPHSLRSEYTDNEFQDGEERLRGMETPSYLELSLAREDGEDDQASNEDTEVDLSVVEDLDVWGRGAYTPTDWEEQEPKATTPTNVNPSFITAS